MKCKMYKLSACSEVVRLQTKFQPGPLAQSKASLVANQGIAGSSPGLANIFVEMYHEIISRVVLPLLLIQVGQMSVSVESMSSKYWLTA